MKKFIVKLIILLISVFIILSIMEYITNYGLKKTRIHNFGEWNDIYNSQINANLLILGSSRAWVEISPRIIDSVLHVNSYNLGMDGTHFDLQNERFKIYLQHNVKPKQIIMTLDLFTLVKRDDLFDELQFYPYINDSIVFNILVQHKGILEKMNFNFPYFRYLNDTELREVGFNEFFNFAHYNSYKYKGYKSNDSKWNNEFELFKNNNSKGIRWKFNVDLINQFISFIQYCKQNNIKIIFVYPPEYYEAQLLTINRKEIMSFYANIAAKNKLLFLDYSNDSICNNKKYFYNSQHLNTIGAVLFSKKLVEDIKVLSPKK